MYTARKVFNKTSKVVVTEEVSIIKTYLINSLVVVVVDSIMVEVCMENLEEKNLKTFFKTLM
jgi:hypothetical protein